MDKQPIKIECKIPPKSKMEIYKPTDQPVMMENKRKKKIVGKLEPKPK